MTDVLREWSSLSAPQRRKATEKAREFVASMEGKPFSWAEVARHVGLKRFEPVRCRLDPDYANYKRAKKRVVFASDVRLRVAMYAENRSARVDPDVVAARLAEIPEDTRTITGRLFGDPLPGRRALDAKCQAKSPSLWIGVDSGRANP